MMMTVTMMTATLTLMTMTRMMTTVIPTLTMMTRMTPTQMTLTRMMTVTTLTRMTLTHRTPMEVDPPLPPRHLPCRTAPVCLRTNAPMHTLIMVRPFAPRTRFRIAVMPLWPKRECTEAVTTTMDIPQLPKK